MESSLATLSPTSPFNTQWISSCAPAKELLTITERMTGANAHELFSKLKTDAINITSFLQQQKSAIVYLAKRSLRAGNVSKKLIDLMDLYEKKPEKVGAVNYLRYYTYGWTITYEEHLPPCQFNVASPLSQERYVVCRQAISFFAEQLAAEILRKCNVDYLSLSDSPTPYQTLGAYLIAAENSATESTETMESSWKIRYQWHQQYKHKFCQTSQSKLWKELECKQDLLKKIKKQENNLQLWFDLIWPRIEMAKGVYTSNTLSEIDYEIYRRRSTLRNFIYQAKEISLNLTQALMDEAMINAEQEKQNRLIEQVVDYKRELKKVLQTYQENRTPALWKNCNQLAQTIQLFLSQNNIHADHPELMELSQRCLDPVMMDEKEL